VLQQLLKYFQVINISATALFKRVKEQLQLERRNNIQSVTPPLPLAA